MARIFTNGNVAIRVHDIVAVDIPDDDAKCVAVYTQHPMPFTFDCESEEAAQSLYESILADMKREL
jgi:hypothetical protein